MTRPGQVEDFTPHYERVGMPDLMAALADLDPVQTRHGVSVALPYTERPADVPLGGTLDTIEIGPYGGTTDWMIYTGRAYHGDQSSASITGQVARCPGHMVILVVRALHAHLSAVGPRGRANTYEGDILYALGLVRVAEDPHVGNPPRPWLRWSCGCLDNEAGAHRVGCPRYPEGKKG